MAPHIDALTMEIHHSKHHQAYVTNLNNALAGSEDEKLNIEEICKNISKYPVAVRNNGGGHFNHSFFWFLMAPNAGGSPTGDLAKAIDASFNSFEEFKKLFSTAGTTRFGSGWAWLILKDGKLVISSTPNQDNPLMDVTEIKGQPILAIDLWEHAYYLNYQNRRPDYIAAFWNVVNWNEIERLYVNEMGKLLKEAK